MDISTDEEGTAQPSRQRGGGSGGGAAGASGMGAAGARARRLGVLCASMHETSSSLRLLFVCALLSSTPPNPPPLPAGQLGAVGRQLGAILGSIVHQLRNIKKTEYGYVKPTKVYDLVFGRVVGGSRLWDVRCVWWWWWFVGGVVVGGGISLASCTASTPNRAWGRRRTLETRITIAAGRL